MPVAGPTRHVVLGVSGGIACYKSCTLARRLTEAGATVDVVLTAAAAEFVWRAHARPITLYSARNGLLFLKAELEGKVRAALDNDVSGLKFREALQMLNNAMN